MFLSEGLRVFEIVPCGSRCTPHCRSGRTKTMPRKSSSKGLFTGLRNCNST